jgi:hypothetical protein
MCAAIANWLAGRGYNTPARVQVRRRSDDSWLKSIGGLDCVGGYPLHNSEMGIEARQRRDFPDLAQCLRQNFQTVIDVQ